MTDKDSLPQQTQRNNHRHVFDPSKPIDIGADDSIILSGQNGLVPKVGTPASIDHWKKCLASLTPTVFPLRSPSSGIPDSSIFRRFCVAHESLSNDNGITFSTLVTLAYALVLSVHSGSSEKVVFGRVHCEQSTTLPQIVTFRWDQMTLDFLHELQNDLAEINDHSLVDLREIPVANIAPLFRTILHVYPIDKQCPNVEHDLAFLVKTTGLEEIEVEVRFVSACILEPEIAIFLDHFGTALESILQNLRGPVRDINLVSSEERQRILVELNVKHPPGTSLSSANNVMELIEEQARKTPQKIALQFLQEQFITYRQMDSFANKLAHTLIANGVMRGDLVGIYMDKSCEMFISIFAIHKAGGAFIPLDPEHPPERIRTILGLAKSKMVLTGRDLQQQLNEAVVGANIASLVVDVHELSLVKPVEGLVTRSDICSGNGSVLSDFTELSPATKPDVGTIGRDDICHVLFTSGSTGTPKGVVLTHGAIIESTVGSREVVGQVDGRVLQFANYTFDVSVWDWSVTLSSGGTLCIAPKRSLMDDLANVANSFDVTLLQLTPTVAALISPEEIPSLQMLTVGGESLTTKVRDTWADAVTLLNLYGPTEASTNVVMNRVSATTEVSNIGHPFGLNIVYILDERLRLVPLGCVGELYIAGPQLARGYLNDPEQTAKAFIDNPFRPGSIMYATGDLVRMSPVDGSITFLGRRDSQMKIRGLRVEAGEIESVLKAATENITNAVVLKVDVGHESLVAFVEYPSDATDSEELTIIHDGLSPLLATLKNAVRRKLPSYMAPAIYVALNRFPLTSSRKLDRKALGAFFYLHEPSIRNFGSEGNGDAVGCQVPDPHSIPQTEVEVVIRSLWASVLRLTEGSLGMEDDFYVSGGDSVSAIQLARAAREAGLHLPASDIIRNPTIRAMARIAESAELKHEFDDDDTPSMSLDRMVPQDLTLLDVDSAGLVRLKDELLGKHGLCASDVLDVYPSTALQTSFLVAKLFVDDSNILATSYNLPRGTDMTKLRGAFEEFIDHPNGMMFRTLFSYEPVSSRWLQVLVRPGAKRMEWTTVAVADEAELDLRVKEYEYGRAIQPFKDGELLTRVCIFELDGYARVLVWSLHHAQTDNWALQNYMSDIEDIYSCRPLPSRRPFKPMVKYLERLDRTAGLDFWRSHLRGASPTPFLLAVPVVAYAPITDIVGHGVEIDHGSFTKQFGIMASTLVTAAWSIVLAAHCNRKDVVFGQVLAGRHAPIRDVGSVVGVAINVVARRVVLDPGATMLETLRGIQLDQTEICKHESIALGDLLAGGVPATGLFRSFLNFTNHVGDRSPIAGGLAHGRVFGSRRSRSGGGFEYPFGLFASPLATSGFYFAAVCTHAMISRAETGAMLDHLRAALLYMANHPHDRLGEFGVL